MKKFVPKDKMSKKAQKELAAQQRTTWTYSPVTKKIDSKKSYNRRRAHAGRDDYGMSSFQFMQLCRYTDRASSLK